MVAAYFRRYAEGVEVTSGAFALTVARLCLVVGDSAPYGVHVPTERWLGQS